MRMNTKRNGRIGEPGGPAAGAGEHRSARDGDGIPVWSAILPVPRVSAGRRAFPADTPRPEIPGPSLPARGRFGTAATLVGPSAGPPPFAVVSGSGGGGRTASADFGAGAGLRRLSGRAARTNMRTVCSGDRFRKPGDFRRTDPEGLRRAPDRTRGVSGIGTPARPRAGMGLAYRVRHPPDMSPEPGSHRTPRGATAGSGRRYPPTADQALGQRGTQVQSRGDQNGVHRDLVPVIHNDQAVPGAVRVAGETDVPDHQRPAGLDAQGPLLSAGEVQAQIGVRGVRTRGSPGGPPPSPSAR